MNSHDFKPTYLVPLSHRLRLEPSLASYVDNVPNYGYNDTVKDKLFVKLRIHQDD
jgi:hypothetical protein